MKHIKLFEEHSKTIDTGIKPFWNYAKNNNSFKRVSVIGDYIAGRGFDFYDVTGDFYQAYWDDDESELVVLNLTKDGKKLKDPYSFQVKNLDDFKKEISEFLGEETNISKNKIDPKDVMSQFEDDEKEKIEAALKSDLDDDSLITKFEKEFNMEPDTIGELLGIRGSRHLKEHIQPYEKFQIIYPIMISSKDGKWILENS